MKLRSVFTAALLTVFATTTNASFLFHQCIPFEKPGSEGSNPSSLKITSNSEELHVLVYSIRDTVKSNLPFDGTTQLPELCSNEAILHGLCTEDQLGKFVIKGETNEQIINDKLSFHSSVAYEVKNRGLYCLYALSEGPASGEDVILVIEENHSYFLSHLSVNDYITVKLLDVVNYVEIITFFLGMIMIFILKKIYKNDKVSLTNSFYAFGLLLFSSLHHSSQSLILQTKDTPSILLPNGFEIQPFYVAHEIVKLLVDYCLVFFIFKWSILNFGNPNDFDGRQMSQFKNIRFCYLLYAGSGGLNILFQYTNIAGSSLQSLTALFHFIMKLYVIIKVLKSFNATHVAMIEKGDDPVIISKFRKTSLMFKLLPLAMFVISLASLVFINFENAKLYSGLTSFNDSVIHIMEAMIRTDLWYAMLLHLPALTYVGITLALVLIWRPVRVVDGEIKLAEDSDFGQLTA